MMIMAIVGTVLVAAVALLLGLVWWVGWLGGLAVAIGLILVLVGVYVWVIRPWHMRWGATDEEVTRTMPGDELIPGAGSATRAITIAATPADVWPWLVQIGYGRAGWYSYDWIDSDLRRSADRVLPECQNLEVGDKILMMPEMGFVVDSIDEPRSIVSVLERRINALVLGPLSVRWRQHAVGEPLAAQVRCHTNHPVDDRLSGTRHLHHGTEDAANHQGPSRSVTPPPPLAAHRAGTFGPGGHRL
jgi:hypothetical protein